MFGESEGASSLFMKIGGCCGMHNDVEFAGDISSKLLLDSETWAADVSRNRSDLGAHELHIRLPMLFPQHLKQTAIQHL